MVGRSQAGGWIAVGHLGSGDLATVDAERVTARGAPEDHVDPVGPGGRLLIDQLRETNAPVRQRLADASTDPIEASDLHELAPTIAAALAEA